MNSVGGDDRRHSRDQLIVQPLMIPLAVVMLDILTHGATEMALADRNHSVEAFFLD
jgi:hypothetical protein